MKAFLITWIFERDEYAQKHGCIDLIWNFGEFRLGDLDFDHQRWSDELYLMSKWLPGCLRAAHICSDDKDPFKQFYARFIVATSPREIRQKFKMHFGKKTKKEEKEALLLPP